MEQNELMNCFMEANNKTLDILSDKLSYRDYNEIFKQLKVMNNIHRRTRRLHEIQGQKDFYVKIKKIYDDGNYAYIDQFMEFVKNELKIKIKMSKFDSDDILEWIKLKK